MLWQVARLVVHDTELNYLKDMFGKEGKKDSDMLIDPSDEEPQKEKSDEDRPLGGGRSASRGRGGWSRGSDEDDAEL